jgi:hypothetical protein
MYGGRGNGVQQMGRKQHSWFDVFLNQERPVWSLWVCQELQRKNQRKERKYRKSSLRMKSTRSMWKRRRRCRVSKRRWKKIVHVHVLLCSQCLLCNVMTSVSYTADGDGFPHVHTVPNKAGYSIFGGTRWCSWFRHCATSRKVAGDIGILHWHNPSDRTMVLGSTQSLTEMSTRGISWRQMRPVPRADNFNTILCCCHEIWEP